MNTTNIDQSTSLSDSALFCEEAFVNGKWIKASDGKTINVHNPCNNKLLGTVPDLGRQQISASVDAAKSAYPAWRSLTAKERSRLLLDWYHLIMENQHDLAILMTLEQGKPLSESIGEIAYASAFIEWFSEEAKRVYGDIIPATSSDKRILVTREPVGVCAAITPWNFPSAMITRKVAPALAAGCTMIVKPAPQTPFSALALARLAEKAGIPDGVLNIVTGSATVVGKELTSNPVVRKLSFTGSTGTGIKLMEQCAPSIKKLSLELGGNAPFIVFDDADIEASVQGAMASKYRNTGQTCVCANRILVQENIHDEFVKRYSEVMQEQLKVGDGLDESVTQGPLIDMAAVEKVEAHIKDAVSKGAKVITGGKRHRLGGTFFQPTLMINVTEEMLVANDETFGPVAPVFRFETVEQAISIANNTEYGLAAYFYTRDISRQWRVSEALEFGIIGINTGIISSEVAPFGGMKLSGIGREGSKYGIDEYLEIKYHCLGEI